jgi:hypothetical protein
MAARSGTSNKTNRFPETRDCQSIAGFCFPGERPENAGKKQTKRMKTNYRRLNTDFGPETRFELNPSAPFLAAQDNRLEALKRRLLLERLSKAGEGEANSLLRHVANEAAAVSWATPFPLLVFPVLFEEKAELALRSTERQARVLADSREFIAV